jgi:NitT/TauT family transport system substrate-binding protein
LDRDVKIQYLASPVELAQLTASGRVPLAVLPEPWVTEVLEKDPQLRVLLNFQKEWKRVEKQGLDYPQTCLVVRNPFARAHPRVLKKFLTELEQSIQWVNRHPKESGDLAQKHLQIPARAAEKGLPHANLKYKPAAAVRPEIDRFLRRLFEMAPESMGGTLPDEGFYYRP